MRPTAIRRVVLIPRELLKKNTNVIPPLKPNFPELQPTVHDILLERKAKAGDEWPKNMRIEPFLTRDAFSKVRKKYIGPLKEFVEREH